MTEPTDNAEPMENAEQNEPMLPIEANEPMLPIDSTEPRDPIDSNESSDQRDRREVMRASSGMWRVPGESPMLRSWPGTGDRGAAWACCWSPSWSWRSGWWG
jgi:hypothetical protein